MIYYSTRPFWLQTKIVNISKSMNKNAVNIDTIQVSKLDSRSICFIPIYGEDELDDNWILFFEKISKNKYNISKQLILFLCGVYDFQICADSTLLKQVNHILKFNSVEIHTFPLKLHKDFFPLENLVYFYEHIPYKKYSEFDILLHQIIFNSKSFPKTNNLNDIDLTNCVDEYSSMLYNKKKNTLKKVISKCDRNKLVLNRVKNELLEQIISEAKNDKIERFYLISNNLNCFPNFKGFSSIKYINLTANYIKLININSLPREIKTLDISKNKVKNINFIENIELKKLCLFNNNLSNIDGIETIHTLEYINLGLNPFEYFPLNLVKCKELKNINLSLTKIKKLPDELLGLEKLENLDLTHCMHLRDDIVANQLKINGVNVVY